MRITNNNVAEIYRIKERGYIREGHYADMDDNRIGKARTPEWNTINIDASLQLKYLDININLINLLNEKYKTHDSGVFGMSRAFGVTVNFHL